IRMVREGEAWIAPEAGEPLRVTVGPSALEWELVSVAWPGRLDAARTDTITVRVRNTGAETWSPAAGDRLSYRWRAAEGAPLQHEGIRTALPGPVGPGEEVALEVAVAGPARAGSYALELAMVRERVRWFPPPSGAPAEATVKVGLRSA